MGAYISGNESAVWSVAMDSSGFLGTCTLRDCGYYLNMGQERNQRRLLKFGQLSIPDVVDLTLCSSRQAGPCEAGMSTHTLHASRQPFSFRYSLLPSTTAVKIRAPTPHRAVNEMTRPRLRITAKNMKARSCLVLIGYVRVGLYTMEHVSTNPRASPAFRPPCRSTRIHVLQHVLMCWRMCMYRSVSTASEQAPREPIRACCGAG